MSFLTGSTNCVKYTLFAFNLVFVITGIILISVGVAVAETFDQYEVFLVNKFFSVPTLLIVIGSFIFVIAFFGCCGAIKENYCMILTFSILLAFIFILELAAGISGYVLRADTYALVNSQLKSTMPMYVTKGDEDVKYIWDYVQREFSCCGVESYQDWKTVTKNDDLPISCCTIPDGILGTFECKAFNENKTFYTDGCSVVFSDFIRAHAVSLGAAAIVIAILQFFGVFFSCYIAREIKIRNGITGFI